MQEMRKRRKESRLLVQRGDRIVAVNGQQGTAHQLLNEMKNIMKLQREPELRLTLERPCPASPSCGPVDISKLTKPSKDDLGMLAQPERPGFKIGLVQVYVRANNPKDVGGSDKSFNGHRFDTVPIVNGMIEAGMSCQPIHYVAEEHDKFLVVCKQFDALILRCPPGHIKADGGEQGKFDEAMRGLRKQGKQIWPSPDVVEQMCAKDALAKISSAKLSIGLEDTFAYCTANEFVNGFRKTMAFRPRVIKPCRGSSGEGVWIVTLKDGNYCKSLGERICEDSEVLRLTEACDNHTEEHTIAEFIAFCTIGRTKRAGTWRSSSAGKYLEGGREAGGQLLDTRFCPRSAEGELRFNFVGDELVGIIHRRLREGKGSVYDYWPPDSLRFRHVTERLIKRDLAKVMSALDLHSEPLPLWWTIDFVDASAPGTPQEQEKWIAREFNCACVGITKCLPACCKADRKYACWDDVPPASRLEAQKIGNLMGRKAMKILSKRVPGQVGLH
jgi:hypothetical protein